MITAGSVGLMELEDGSIPLTLIKRPALESEAEVEELETIIKPIQGVLNYFRVFT